MPTPSRNRPGIMVAVVAAACAMIAGCVRISGHVTAVAHGIASVTSANAPSTRPHERALPLLVVPGVEVVRDPAGLEAGLLGAPGAADELGGRALFARERDSDDRHC